MRTVTYSIEKWLVLARFGLVPEVAMTIAYKANVMLDHETLTLDLSPETVERIKSVLGAKCGL